MANDTSTLDAFQHDRKKKSWNPFKRNKAKPERKRFDDKDVKSLVSLGGGSANDVHKVKYGAKIGDSGTKEGFWKGANGNEAAKSLASGRVDKLIGTDVLSRDVEAKHQGVKGITSAKVGGSAMSSKKFEQDVTDQFVNGLGNGDWDFALQEMKAMQVMAGVKVDQENQKIFGLTGDEHRDIDFTNPEVQRGLANLQLVDYLTGQQDRHEGNIYVDDQTGTVKGIDNDMSFSEQMTPGSIDNMTGFDTKQMGLPSQIDAMVGLKLLFMSDDEYLQSLLPQNGDTSSLSQKEIEVAMDRFHRLKSHIDDQYMNDELVYQWGDYTYDQAKDNKSSYLGRGLNARK